MEHIGKHMSGAVPRPKRDKATRLDGGVEPRRTERGELMQYFIERLNPARIKDGYAPLTMGRMARLLLATPTKDLYYLKSICDEAKDFSKKFWWEINPKKHEQK